MIYIKLVAILVPIMLVIDAIWIGGVMKSFYNSNLGYIMSGTIKWLPAVVFYVLYVFGLVYFIVIPGASTSDLLTITLKSAFFGLVAYGTYDLTNHATLTNWPWIVTVVDMAWGACITGILGAIGFLVFGFLS